MSDMKQTENVKAKGKIRGLKLKRETLRELDAGELKQAQGGHYLPTSRGDHCPEATQICTRGCGNTRNC